MKLLLLSASISWTTTAFSQSDSLKTDSLKTITLSEATVAATRASEKSPTAFINLDKKTIEDKNLGQDIPYLLSTTPSVVITSDAGTGIGYTGMRIRGSDATRVNVTINGIPVNDAESHLVYWVDFPDFASSIENVQIQRGIGTSTNGGGAFGGSVNIQSSAPATDRFATVSSSYGSFNSLKNTISFGTGILKKSSSTVGESHDMAGNGFEFDGRLSKITSDGYIDRATADLKSFYFSGGYYGSHHSLKAIIFSGHEKTYQSWNGVPGAKVSGNYDSLLTHYYNNVNYSGALYFNPPATDSVNLFNSNNRTYNYFTYPNQTDNYQQDYYQLHYTFVPSSYVNLSAALHYTKGKGYYEEYKTNDKFSNYMLPAKIINTDTILSSDVIRQKWLDNDFYGFTYAMNYENGNLLLTLGGAGNRYTDRHFNQVLWMFVTPPPSYPYIYEDNEAIKNDFNTFLKMVLSVNRSLHLFADVQYRTIDYSFPAHITFSDVTQKKNKMNFFNPKGGVTYELSSQANVYASVAVGHKEPVRDDFVDAAPGQLPKPEEMIDYEAGLRFHNSHFSTQMNFYYMYYNHQLILTGKVNDVGEYIRENVERSYRSGLEFVGTYIASKKVNAQLTATLSKNQIKTFYETLVDASDNHQEVFVHEHTDIAFSPALTGAADITYSPFKNFTANLVSRYVGKQYLDNTSNENRRLNPYFVNDLIYSYHLKASFTKDIAFRFGIYNVLNEIYESNGYTYSYIYGSVITENFYFPQAGRNFLGSITVKF